jgi:diacylglycerol kinase family enzyme
MTTALLIRNPVARRRLSEERLAQVLAVARDAGWEIAAVAAPHAGAATHIARDAAERGIDVVVVYGGDGTINEAINGLAGTNTAMAALRGGTANVWAKETQCAKDPVKSMRAIVTGERRRIDLGRANDRCTGCSPATRARMAASRRSRIEPSSMTARSTWRSCGAAAR